MTETGKKQKKNAHLWVRDPDDFYIEPEWCARRLFELVHFTAPLSHRLGTIADPSCGTGRIVKAARAAGYDATGSDIKQRVEMFHGFRLRDFLKDGCDPADWIVSNPPFKHCGMSRNDPPPPYVVKALSIARVGCALLLPLPWIGGQTRGHWLASAGLSKVLVITPRPSMPPGAVILAGEPPGGGEQDFAWFIFRKGHTGPWTGGWCDYQPPPGQAVASPDKPKTRPARELVSPHGDVELRRAVAALEG